MKLDLNVNQILTMASFIVSNLRIFPKTKFMELDCYYMLTWIIIMIHINLIKYKIRYINF